MNPAFAPVALLGDAHLRAGDPEVAAFVRFLDRLPRDLGMLAILGDLFAVWIGRPELTHPHHAEVVAALRRLRSRGCRLAYVEGNHDFFLRSMYAGDPFELFAEDRLEITQAGRRLHMTHGDLVNRHDRQYLAWRSLSKSRPFFGAFNMIPRVGRLKLADRIERRMATTNMEHRGGFPVAECLAYARPRVRDGVEVLVFGHFHEEREIAIQEKERHGVVYVLPAWRSGHRYLRIDPGREPAFVSS